jgi:DNA-binding MarR family transcriptional regulator
MTQAHELPRLLRAAYFAMHRVSDAHFASQGITADQFVLLACLAEQNAVMQQDLVRRAASDPSTVRAMLVLLEGRGLVVRERHPADGRARKVSLTTKGRRLYERLWTTSEPIRTQLLAGFSSHEADSLLDFLHRLIDNMGLTDNCRSRQHSKQAAALGGTL